MTVAARAVRPEIEEALSAKPVSRRTGRVEATFDDEALAACGRVEAATVMSGLGRERPSPGARGGSSFELLSRPCARTRPGGRPGFRRASGSGLGSESLGRGVQGSTITGHGDGPAREVGFVTGPVLAPTILLGGLTRCRGEA